MIRKIFTAACTVLLSACCMAQDGPAFAKKYDQYIGVQANQLIKQLVNLNNSNSVIDDPYLLTYAIHLAKNGWGIQVGMGYDYEDVKDDLPVARESKINNLFYRIGVGQKVMIGKRFEAGYGLDFVADYQSNKTFSSSVTVTNFSVDSSSSSASTKVTSSGFGPRINLNFYISGRVLLGTETTYYFTSSSQKQNVLATDNIINQGSPNTTSTANTNTESKISRFSFKFPVALFLIVKF